MSLGSYQSRRISLGRRTSRQTPSQTAGQAIGQKVRSRRERDFNYICNGRQRLGFGLGLGLGWGLELGCEIRIMAYVAGALAIIYINTITTQRHCTCIIVCSRCRSRSKPRDRAPRRRQASSLLQSQLELKLELELELQLQLQLPAVCLVCILIYWNHVSESILIQIHFRSRCLDTRTSCTAGLHSLNFCHICILGLGTCCGTDGSHITQHTLPAIATNWPSQWQWAVFDESPPNSFARESHAQRSY